MRKILFALVAIGLAGGVLTAYVSSATPQAAPPLFTPAPDPFVSGIYANGIVESFQGNGNNTNIYPVVAGTVVTIPGVEGRRVAKGDILLTIDDSIQRATTEQQRAQAEAAKATLDELRAEPRHETLEVARAQVELAEANLRTARAQLAKQQRSFDLDSRSISRDTLDNATNAVKSNEATVDVAKRQFELTRAGAWSYDIRNQERTVESLEKAYESGVALLDKYTIRAPRDGIVMAIGAAVGSYVSPQGVYNPYTQQNDPIIVMRDIGTLAVRCYIDEILIPRLPAASNLMAKMFIRGTTTSMPLEFVRVQPLVTPKIQLSNARTERVDLRVLPVIFSFTPQSDEMVYPGQLVDVYLGEKQPARTAQTGMLPQLPGFPPLPTLPQARGPRRPAQPPSRPPPDAAPPVMLTPSELP